MNNTYDLNIAKYHDMLVRINSHKLIYFLSLYLINFLWFPEKKKILQNFYLYGLENLKRVSEVCAYFGF